MKRARDEWQSPQFHHRTVDTASNSQKKRVTEQELDKLLRLFKTSNAVILTTSNEPIEAGRAVSKERTCSEPTAIHLPEGIEKQLNFQFTI